MTNVGLTTNGRLTKCVSNRENYSPCWLLRKKLKPAPQRPKPLSVRCTKLNKIAIETLYFNNLSYRREINSNYRCAVLTDVIFYWNKVSKQLFRFYCAQPIESGVRSPAQCGTGPTRLAAHRLLYSRTTYLDFEFHVSNFTKFVELNEGKDNHIKQMILLFNI